MLPSMPTWHGRRPSRIRRCGPGGASALYLDRKHEWAAQNLPLSAGWRAYDGFPANKPRRPIKLKANLAGGNFRVVACRGRRILELLNFWCCIPLSFEVGCRSSSQTVPPSLLAPAGQAGGGDFFGGASCSSAPGTSRDLSHALRPQPRSPVVPRAAANAPDAGSARAQRPRRRSRSWRRPCW